MKKHKRKVVHSYVDPREKAKAMFKAMNMTDGQAKREAYGDILTIFFVALRRLPKDRFGVTRLARLYDAMHELDADIAAGYANLADMREQLAKEAHMQLDAETAMETMKRKKHWGKVKYRVTSYMSALYMWSLHDTFGWSMTRIWRAYKICVDIANKLNAGTVKIDALEAELDRSGWQRRNEKWEIVTA